MISDILSIGIDLLAEFNGRSTGWIYSNEEFDYVSMIIKHRIYIILEILMRNGKIDKINRDVTVIINPSFDKVLVLIGQVYHYDVAEVLMAMSQSFYSLTGWQKEAINFNTIKIRDEKIFIITKMTSLVYM